MEKNKLAPSDLVNLRMRAEGIVQEQDNLSPVNVADLPAPEISRTLHELQVHQIELEMQNDELLRSQLELEAARERYFDLYDLAPVGYVTLSKQSLIMKANLTAANLLGVNRRDLEKYPLTCFILMDYQDCFYHHRKKLIDTGEPQACDLHMLTNNGGVFWAHLKLTVGQAGDGTPEHRAVLIDITERKHAEERLNETIQRLKLATSSARLGVWDWDLTSNKMVWDDRMLELYGLTKETFSGGIEAWENGLHPEDRDKTIKECQAVLRGEKEWDTNFRVLHPDKMIKHIKAEGMVFRNPVGTPVRMLGINLDITASKQAEEAVRKSDEKYRIINEQSPIAIVFYDSEGFLVSANPACLELFGIKDINEIIKCALFDDPNISDEHKNDLKCGKAVRYQAYFDFDKIKEFNLFTTTKSGQIYLDVIFSIIKSDIETTGGYLLQIQDFTERKQAEQEKA